MEIETIVGALVAGAAAQAQKTGGSLVKDAYSGLKNMLSQTWKKAVGPKKEAEVDVLLDNLEEDAETYQAPVAKKLTAAVPNPDAEIQALAETLKSALEQEHCEVSKYITNVSNCTGVIVGDHATLNMQK